MQHDLQPRIVIIEDEQQIRRFLRTTLEAAGFEVFDAENAQRGLVETATRKPDILVLDLGLPDMDGIEIIRDVRTWSQVPIIVLSARTNEQQKVLALDTGADDYLSKPFGTAELLARIRAHLRRHEGHQTSTADEYTFGDVVINYSQRSVTRNGERLHLTPIEYRLLMQLIKNPGKVITHRQLLKEVWGPHSVEQAHYLRTYMVHLRQKLEQEPANPKYLLTETGIGYRFQPEDSGNNVMD
jgi:two-component system KDP operon response regulator KdpE